MWPNDAIWHHRTILTPPRHYQWGLFSYTSGHFQEMFQLSILDMGLKIANSRLRLFLPEDNELRQNDCHSFVIVQCYPSQLHRIVILASHWWLFAAIYWYRMHNEFVHIENSVLTGVSHCLCSRKRVISVIITRVVKQKSEMNSGVTLKWVNKEFVWTIHTLVYFLKILWFQHYDQNKIWIHQLLDSLVLEMTIDWALHSGQKWYLVR